MKADPAAIDAALVTLRRQLDQAEAHVKQLQYQRVRWWQAARERDPETGSYGLTIPQLMAASGVSESLIHKELTKARNQARNQAEAQN